MNYSTQKIIEILEKKGFIVEEPYGNGILHCIAVGYNEIIIAQNDNGHMFKVLTKHTVQLKKALEWAGVEQLEDVA